MEKHYEVIIIGGRVAGASLAIRLGKQGRKVLLIDRATFPSWPSVPSSPMEISP
jgi:flavin-dependent dehydrogenase